MKTISQLPILKGNQNKIFLTILLVFSTLALDAQAARGGSMLITFTDIRSDIGILRTGVYSAEDQWIYDPEYSFKWSKKDLVDGTLKVEIPNLPFGTYSISVLDDEDQSNSMNYFMGLPKEGWGMSTNPSFFKLKAPSYEECAFELDCPCISFEINLNYLNKRKNVK